MLVKARGSTTPGFVKWIKLRFLFRTKHTHLERVWAELVTDLLATEARLTLPEGLVQNTLCGSQSRDGDVKRHRVQKARPRTLRNTENKESKQRYKTRQSG